MKSCLFERLALSEDKEGILKLAKEGHLLESPEDLNNYCEFEAEL
jgi:hypothetical protein